MLPFTPNDYPNARSANPELSSVFNKINHLTSQIIPDNYPYSTEMASLSNLWITIDLVTLIIFSPAKLQASSNSKGSHIQNKCKMI
jgi:hypothetical protein